MLAITSFLAFTLAAAFAVYWFTRKDRMNSAEAYFLGGRSLTAWVIAGSLVLTNLSTEHLIGLNGDAFRHTMAVTAWETTSALAMILTALYFLPKYLHRGLSNIPQFLAERYDETTRTIATGLFLFSYVVATLPVVLLFGATGIESLFDLSAKLGVSYRQSIYLLVWGVGLLGSLYAVIGGLKAVAISDTVNGIGFLAAGLLIPLLALMQIGDGNPWAGLNQVYSEEKPKFDVTGDEPGAFLPFSVLFTGMIVNQVFFWCANQSIVQRAMAAKNLAEGQKGVLIAAAFKLLGPLIIVLPGVIAYHMFKGELAPEDYLLAYPSLVKAVLPPFLVGFFAAVMVGAVLSTFNSVLNSSATLFSEGIYRSLVNPAATGRQLILSGRAASILLALAAMIAAPLIDTGGSLYNYLQKINATFFGPMLAVILVGFFTRRVPASAAQLGLIGGPALFFIVAFVFPDSVNHLAAALFGARGEVHFLHTLALVFVLTAGMMLVLGRFRPREAPKRAARAAPVDMTPWKHAGKTSLVIAIATIGFYLLLAQ